MEDYLFLHTQQRNKCVSLLRKTRMKNLKIAEYEKLNSNFEKVKDPVVKESFKYENHTSIIAIKEKEKHSKFTFHKVGNEKIIKRIKVK